MSGLNLGTTVNIPVPTGIDIPTASCRNADAPIFLTGFARSGTTWLNTLLCDYFDAGFVNEGQFIVSFGRRIAQYGDLRVDGNLGRLIRDLRRDHFFVILKRNYGVAIDWNRVGSTSRTFAAFVLDILGQIAIQMGKSRIGSKYPVFGCHLELLNRHFPKCRVVHVIRDGRDCALSHRHVRWGHQNSYAAAVHWRDYLHVAREAAREMPGRYLEIRYEDLLAEPEASMTVLEEFLTGASGPVTARFMTDAKRLKPEKIARWRQDMSPRAQAVFESVAADVLRDLGYPLTGTAHRPAMLSKALYTAHDRLTREGWHWARKLVPAIPERKR